MNIGDLLAPERVNLRSDVGSKKKALEVLSELLVTALPSHAQGEVFDSLLARERLGSTGLGHGVAIPHGRLPGLTDAVAAFLRLERGVDYDAPDHEPVDLLFALVVPEKCSDVHLKILAALARMFSDSETLAGLRAADGPALLGVVARWPIEEPDAGK